MAIDFAAVTTAEWALNVSDGDGDVRTYTALVIFEGSAYSALCLELDIASCGDTAQEAYFALKAAVRESLAVAAEKGISAGEPVSDANVVEFLSHHKVVLPVESFTFAA